MTIQKFKDGAVLVTGNDIYSHLMNAMNRRNNVENDCSFCEHEETKEDNEFCDGCSIPDDLSCSCHIRPPCSKCENSRFEPSINLINYKHYHEAGKWRWECFRADKITFKKLSDLEKKGYELSAETLNTGVIAIYLGDDIELSDRQNFKGIIIKLVNRFKNARKIALKGR